MAGEPIRVFLLDDHEIVRRGIADLLSRSDDIDVVGEAATVAEARARIVASKPDVVLLDARLPDGSGIDLCRDIRSTLCPGARCVILTSYDDNDALFAAVLAGADGYLLKSVRGTNLLDAIRQLADGHSLLDPAVTGQLLQRLRDHAHPDPRLAALNERDRELVQLITDGLSNRQIAAQLFLAEQTVKNRITGLLTKLGMERRTQVAIFGAELKKR